MQSVVNQQIRKFEYVSVRESSGAYLLKEHLGIDAYVVPDPTLLLEAADYDKLMDDVSYTQTKHADIFCYILDMTSETRNAIETFATNNGMIVDFIHDYQKGIYPDVCTWLDGIRNARFVLTNSFHGTVFSLIYGKPMWILENKMRGNARLADLLAIFNLSSRMISIQALNDIDVFETIDIVDVKKIHKDLREQGVAFLENAGIACRNK